MTRSQEAAITRAIADAEKGTTGRIAVRIIPDAAVDAFARARREFEHVGLHRYPHANAALILVAPKARQFAVMGDRDLHARVGDAFWQDVVRQSRPYFERGDVYGGIQYAVGRIGEALDAHFPVPAEVTT